MNSKTSLFDKFFSKALLKADLKNHWVWMVVASAMVIINVLILPSSFVYAKTFNAFIMYMSFSLFVAGMFGFFIGTKLFMYLDKVNSVSCMHGLPFSRRKLYLSHLLAGEIITLSPGVIAFLMLLITSPGNDMITPLRAAGFLAMYAIYSLIAFSISVFSMTVCGNVVVSMLFSCAIAVMPAALIAFIAGVCTTNIYGFVFDENILEKILNFIYVAPTAMFPWRFAVYIGAALIFYVAGYFIYKIRPLENCDEVVAFRKLQGLFVYAVGIVCGMISYLLFSIGTGNATLLHMLPLGLVGIAVSAMIAKKSVNLSGTVHYFLIFTGVVAAAWACISFDVFGYERRVPEVSDVEYVEVGNFYSFAADSEFVRFSEPDYKIEDPEDIQKVIDLHKAYISDKDTDKDAPKNYYDDSYVIKYKLKDGSTLIRSYSFLSDENYEKYLSPVRDTDEFKSVMYPIYDTTEKKLLTVSVSDYLYYEGKVTYSGKDIEAKELYEAVCKDIKENRYSDLNSNGYLEINFHYFVPGELTGGVPIPTNIEERYSLWCSVTLNENYKNTFAVLEKYGFFEKTKLLPERITAVMLEIEGEENSVRITDRAVMQEIYEFTKLGNGEYVRLAEKENAQGISFLFIAGDAVESRTVTYYFTPEKTPEFLKEYVK